VLAATHRLVSGVDGGFEQLAQTGQVAATASMLATIGATVDAALDVVDRAWVARSRGDHPRADSSAPPARPASAARRGRGGAAGSRAVPGRKRASGAAGGAGGRGVGAKRRARERDGEVGDSTSDSEGGAGVEAQEGGDHAPAPRHKRSRRVEGVGDDAAMPGDAAHLASGTGGGAVVDADLLLSLSRRTQSPLPPGGMAHQPANAEAAGVPAGAWPVAPAHMSLFGFSADPFAALGLPLPLLGIAPR
jgi:hypothetical protein